MMYVKRKRDYLLYFLTGRLGYIGRAAGKGGKRSRGFCSKNPQERNLKILSNLKGEIALCHIALTFYAGK